MHQQTAVVVTEAGGVVVEVIVTALNENFIPAATVLLSNLVGNAVSTSRLEGITEPVIGFKAGRHTAVGAL